MDYILLVRLLSVNYIRFLLTYHCPHVFVVPFITFLLWDIFGPPQRFLDSYRRISTWTCIVVAVDDYWMAFWCTFVAICCIPSNIPAWFAGLCVSVIIFSTYVVLTIKNWTREWLDGHEMTSYVKTTYTFCIATLVSEFSFYLVLLVGMYILLVVIFHVDLERNERGDDVLIRVQREDAHRRELALRTALLR
jgi:hypothetical protein